MQSCHRVPEVLTTALAVHGVSPGVRSSQAREQACYASEDPCLTRRLGGTRGDVDGLQHAPGLARALTVGAAREAQLLSIRPFDPELDPEYVGSAEACWWSRRQNTPVGLVQWHLKEFSPSGLSFPSLYPLYHLVRASPGKVIDAGGITTPLDQLFVRVHDIRNMESRLFPVQDSH